MRVKGSVASAATVLVLLFGTCTWPGVASANTTKPNAKARILRISDMPSGWTVDNSSNATTDPPTCLSGLKGTPKGGTRASVSFNQGGSTPDFAEVLVTGPSEAARFKAVNAALAKCKSFSFSSQGTTYGGSVGAMSLPKVGDKSSAYTMSLSVKGIKVGIDFVLFKAGPYYAVIEYADLGSPQVTQLQHLVNLAVTKAQAGSTSAANASAVVHVGATQAVSDESGDQASVTLTQVIDPATSDNQYLTPDPGKRFVATVLTIRNTGSSALQGDADSDSTLIGSDNQSYTADFSSVSECTNFANGSYQLNVGESVNGCVTFQLPIGVSPSKFKYSASGGFGGAFSEWLIP